MVMFSVEPVTVWSTQFNAPATAGGQVALAEKVGPETLPLNEIVPVPVESTVPDRGGETGEDESQLRPLGGSSVTLHAVSHGERGDVCNAGVGSRTDRLGGRGALVVQQNDELIAEVEGEVVIAITDAESDVDSIRIRQLGRDGIVGARGSVVHDTGGQLPLISQGKLAAGAHQPGMAPALR